MLNKDLFLYYNITGFKDQRRAKRMAIPQAEICNLKLFS